MKRGSGGWRNLVRIAHSTAKDWASDFARVSREADGNQSLTGCARGITFLAIKQPMKPATARIWSARARSNGKTATARVPPTSDCADTPISAPSRGKDFVDRTSNREWKRRMNYIWMVRELLNLNRDQGGMLEAIMATRKGLDRARAQLMIHEIGTMRFGQED